MSLPSRRKAAKAGLLANLAAALFDEPAHRLGDLLVIDDARLRHEQPGHAGNVRLMFLDLLGREPAHAGQTIGPAPAFEVVQGGNFARFRGDDDFAAAFMADVVLLAEAIHFLPADGAILGLEGTGLVVEPAVNDAAVVAGLMGGQLGLGFEQDQRQVAVGQEGVGRGQADDAAADNGHVVGGSS